MSQPKAVDDELAPLLSRLRAGIDAERSALRLDALLRPRLRRYFAAHGWGSAEGEDLVQGTLARVFQGVSGLREASSFLPWLFVVARNVRRDEGARLGHWQREQAVGLDDVPEPAAAGPSQEAALVATERLRAVRTAIAALPAQQRQCLLLHLREELPYEQIAATLHLSVHTVRNHLAQARKNLRRRLGEAGLGGSGR